MARQRLHTVNTHRCPSHTSPQPLQGKMTSSSAWDSEKVLGLSMPRFSSTAAAAMAGEVEAKAGRDAMPAIDAAYAAERGGDARVRAWSGQLRLDGAVSDAAFQSSTTPLTPTLPPSVRFALRTRNFQLAQSMLRPITPSSVRRRDGASARDGVQVR